MFFLEKLRAYIDKLREAAYKLTTHNRRLIKAHNEIGQIVVECAKCDLFRSEQLWANKLTEIRQRFADEERFVAVKANMQPWVSHWNRQLYKALQSQFQLGIENINAQLPILNAQLVFRSQRLQLRPPLEELRANFYRELVRFLRIKLKLN